MLCLLHLRGFCSGIVELPGPFLRAAFTPCHRASRITTCERSSHIPPGKNSAPSLSPPSLCPFRSITKMGAIAEAGQNLLCCSRNGRTGSAAANEFSKPGQLCDLLLSKLRFSLRRVKRAKQPHRLARLKASSHTMELGAPSLPLCQHPPARHGSPALPAIQLCESGQVMVLEPQE